MKKIIILLLTLVLAVGLIACKKEDVPPVESPIVETPVEEPVEEPIMEEPVVEGEKVKLYFVNEEYIQTGNESLEKLIPEYWDMIELHISVEEAIVRALMEGPKKEGVRTVIPATAKLLGVEVKDGTAFVDFASEGMHGGSLEETFTINQIVASLIELDTVDRVQFLLDGEKGDSLMGHYGIEEPFEAPLE